MTCSIAFDHMISLFKCQLFHQFSQGIINFTINICPSGSMAIGNKKEAIDDLLDGIDI